MPRQLSRQRSSYQIGMVAEYLCILRLWLTGWRILAWRYKQPMGEVDIIARRGEVIAFIEVKARESRQKALEAVSMTQKKRIEKSASHWLSRNLKYAGFCPRFDIMWVTKWPWPQREAHAWEVRETY